MPQELNGNASTKYGDYYWKGTTPGKIITLFGGNWDRSYHDGLSSFDLSYSSTISAITLGSRLLKTAL
ncbi:MAG: hypothetical protein RSD09_04825, partial [Bacilli bacterium]